MTTVLLEQQPWWPDALAESRKRSLRSIARQYGTTVAALEDALRRLGLLTMSGPTPHVSAAPSDAAVSAEVGAAAPGARARLDAVVDRLGREPDGVVARAAGVARKTVVEYRKAHGIPPYRGATAVSTTPARRARRSENADAEPLGASAPGVDGAAASRVRPSLLDRYAAWIGVLPDREVAERAGVSAENVRMYRMRRSIPAGWRAAPTDVAAAPGSAAPAVTFAWRVFVSRVDGDAREFGVIAPDLVGAIHRAESALRADGWIIDGVRRLGEALGTPATGPAARRPR